MTAGLRCLVMGFMFWSGCAAYGQSSSETSTARIEGQITPAAEKAIDSGLQWLAGRHNVDGTFGDDRLLKGNTGVCGLAGLAFLAQGSGTDRGPYADHIRRCIEYLRTHFDPESGLIDNPDYQSSGPMYGHGFATLFLAEVYGNAGTDSLKPLLEKSVSLIVNSQNPAGGWRYQPRSADADLSVTVCQIMALRATRNAGIFVPTETIDRAVDYIRRSRNDDGGYCYQLDGPRESGFARTAAALVGLQSAGVYRGLEISSGIQYLQQNRPDFRNQEGTYYYYGHYYAIQAFWQVGDPVWQRWFPTIRDELVSLQQTEGHWPGKYSREYSTAMSLIVLQVPNNVLPIFQR